MKKSSLVFMLILVILTISYEGFVVIAEDSIIQITEEYIYKIVDFSDKSMAVMGAEGYEKEKGIILFDFTKGNHFVMAIDGNQCELFYYFNDDELMSTMIKMILEFNTISSKLPRSKTLEYEIRFSDSQTYYITPETISKYYSFVFK